VESDRSPFVLKSEPWWRRRVVKAMAIVIVGMTVFYVVDRQLAERAWKAYRREAVAKGVKLSLADYDTPAIPDEENFAAVPFFRNLFTSADAVAQTEKRLTLPQVDWAKKKKAAPSDLERWQTAFVKAGWITSSTSDPALDVLAAMERKEKVLSQVRLACTRPKTRWPLDWDQMLTGDPPMIKTLYKAESMFSLRAKAFLALGRTDEAQKEILNIIRMANSLNGLPTRWPGYCRQRLLESALALATEGVRGNQWSAAQRKVLSEAMNAGNELEYSKASMDGERCIINSYFEKLMPRDSTTFVPLLGQMYGFGRFQFDSVLRVAPRGWIRRAQVEYNRQVDADLNHIEPRRELIDPALGEHGSEFTFPRAKLFSFRPAKRLAAIATVIPYFYLRPAATHTRIRQFPVLCALADYHEVHGEFPLALNQLAPEFLDVVPHDVMDGQPMRYRRLENGGCLVWSIGHDRIDHGGEKAAQSRSWANGPDWVSELPPPGKTISTSP
jgi:hypothetical protein